MTYLHSFRSLISDTFMAPSKLEAVSPTESKSTVSRLRLFTFIYLAITNESLPWKYYRAIVCINKLKRYAYS